jgi:hypothetical protein
MNISQKSLDIKDFWLASQAFMIAFKAKAESAMYNLDIEHSLKPKNVDFTPFVQPRPRRVQFLKLSET